MFEIKTSVEGIIIKIHVLPKSSRNQISGVHRDALKLKITSPPVEGAANKMCIQYLAKQLGVARSRLEIVSGHSSRTKRLLIRAVGKELLQLKKKIKSLAST